MKKALAEKKGGHSYKMPRLTFNCMFGCGCWIGSQQSGGPEGVDPHGKCPKNTKNKKRGFVFLDHL